MGKKPPQSIMRSLGAFVGHVMQGIKTDPSQNQAAPQGTPVDQGMKRETVQEEVRETQQGRVILRRTVIEEIVAPEVRAGVGGSSGGGDDVGSATRPPESKKDHHV